MRPVRIELDGFSAFRDRTVVDFAGADLFAFVGPTGAGKSSVIDGMIFALYGSVPRYQSENLVHPVITQGKPEARVRLDFELDGEAYTAVRVVRRTKSGATTKEARLEHGEEILADDARSVQRVATELLGLDLAQFTKCVVLPQGAFAQLLHDTSGKRQDLLVKLLDFGIYEQVAKAARSRVQESEQRLAVLDAQLDEVAGATDQAVRAAAARVAELAALRASMDDLDAELRRVDDERRSVADRAARFAEQLDALAGVVVPDGVAEIAAELTAAQAAVEAAATAETEAAARVDHAAAARDALGDPVHLRELLQAHATAADLRERVAKGESVVADRQQAVDEANTDLATAGATVERADQHLAAVRVEHAAADLARHLHQGDDCPVCGNTVGELPAERDDAALVEAEEQARAARRAAAEATQAAGAAGAELQALQERLSERRGELATVEEKVADAPSADQIRADLDALAAADAALEAARAADRSARQQASAARDQLSKADARARDARSELTAARDRVASVGPPATTDDLVADWAALDAWAAEQRGSLDAQATALRRRRDELDAQRREVLSEAVSRAEHLGLTVTGDHVRDAVVAAVADATATHERLVAQHERAAGLRAEHDRVAEARDVHDALAKELHPRRFEAWLLEEALASLVAGATERLEQLSSARYALALDEHRNFEVIDHANADERRLARTLSGGETFLASLALALALAERVSELSVTGQRSLDAIFLDEGFGTLDPETLDVVATAIEELGAGGRMVGVVSHVRELAERVPVRFEVRRGPTTSTVERIET